MQRHLVRMLDNMTPAIATRMRRTRDRWRLKKDARTTPFGFRFKGNEAMEAGTFEPEETFIIQKLLDSSDAFVNVGANIGYYCCMAMAKGVRTIALEPMEVNLQLLQQNLVSNDFTQGVEIFPIAASERPGIVKIYGNGTGASLIKGWAGVSEDFFTHAPSNTLDNILGNRFESLRTLYLVDIEGAEFEALQGAHGILAQSQHATWVVEICVSEHQPQGRTLNPRLLDTFQIFWRHGYEAHTASRQPRPVTQAMVEQIVSSGTDTLGTHNFIFVKQGVQPPW